MSIYRLPVTRHERWIDVDSEHELAWCSGCGEMLDAGSYNPVTGETTCSEEAFGVFKRLYRYCPNCGARMDLEEENTQ